MQLFTVVGFVLMLGIYYLDYSILGKYGKWMAGVFLALMGLTIPCRLYMGGAGTYLRLGNMAVSVPFWARGRKSPDYVKDCWSFR